MRELIGIFALTVVLSFLPLNESLAADEFKCSSKLSADAGKTTLAKIEKQYRQFSDLKAEFIQFSYFSALGERVHSSGSVFFRKPGMMDWKYEYPEKQQFVTDGETLWFYQPELNQATLGIFREAFDSDLPVSFLLGIGGLKDNFTLETACATAAGFVLKLLPKKPDPNLEEFHLLVRAKDYVPVGAKVVDVAGNETVITFNKVQLNIGVTKEHFKFSLPRGVDIIDHRKSATPSLKRDEQ